jgi:hypothetical protein
MTGVRDPSRATPASREARAVTSRDGTRSAFDRMGDGPAVILVGGATMVRQGNGGLAEALASELTVLNYNRRGRGGSGDTPPYALHREILVAVEHTLAYDAACLGTGQPPVDRLGLIAAPTLVLTGAPDGGHEVLSTGFFEDAARAIVASVPSAEHRRIPSQSHRVDSHALAPVLAAFYKG